MSPQTARVLGTMHDVRYLNETGNELFIVLNSEFLRLCSLGNIFAIKGCDFITTLWGYVFSDFNTSVYSETKPDGIMLSGFFIFKKGEMQMTILDEVLIEEYNRMESYRRAFIRVLEENPNDERKNKIRQQIERIEFDQKKILAALEVAGINIEDHLDVRPLQII